VTLGGLFLGDTSGSVRDWRWLLHRLESVSQDDPRLIRGDHMADDVPMDHVLATYREIAEHFRLGSTRAARTKAQRAGWELEPANHPADPRRVRVPRAPWDKAADQSRDQKTEPPVIKRRSSKDQRHDGPMINRLDALVAPLREQLERERGRADSAETELRAIREKLSELREERAAAIAQKESAEAQLDDAKAEARSEGEGRAKLQARLELVQAENEKLRAEAARGGQEDRRRRRWLFWGRRRG
jgi:hypothetical protein